MKRTTIFLADDVHERLRQDAFRTRVSMAELIRMRIEIGEPAQPRATVDPLLAVAGKCRGPVLSANIDEELYGD